MNKRLTKIVRSAALAAVGTLAAAQAASAQQSVRLVNHAALSGSQVAKFTNAAQKVINGNMYYEWGTRSLNWTSSSRGSWTIELYNRLGPVEAACGARAAACHYVKHGKPHAIIDTRAADTGRIWSVAGTHELEEMWVDPYLNHTIKMQDGSGDRWLAEVSDPVEDWHHNVQGVQVSDYVYPDWYLSHDTQQDDMNWLVYYGRDTWDFSCPSGYAFYSSWDGWHGFGPGYDGRGCNSMHSAHGAAMGRFVKRPSMNGMRASTPSVNAQGDKIAIFPVAK